MRTIFWSLFGQIDRESFKIEKEGYEAIWRTGVTLFGAFNIMAVLVALNMLIAMLNESYSRITVNTTCYFPNLISFYHSGFEYSVDLAGNYK